MIRIKYNNIEGVLNIDKHEVLFYQFKYSCILEDFAIYNSSEDTRTDPKGNSYTRDEYEMLLPLMYTRQLMMDNRLEDTIRGVATDMQTFNKARAYNRIRPNDFHGFQALQPRL